MLNADTIAAMTSEDKLAAFEALAEAAMPGAATDTLAARMGYSRRAVQIWKKEPDRIPTVVLLLLQEWGTQGNRTVQAGVILADVCSGLQGVSQLLAEAAKALRAK